MMVKVCGITNRVDALASADAGASAIGFNFYPNSPRYIRPEDAAEIGRDLSVLKVGVFVNEAPARIGEIARAAGLDIVQVYGDEQPADLPRLRVWRAFRVASDWRPAVLDSYGSAEAFLLDGPAPGTGAQFDWSQARGLPHRIVLAGGLDSENVARAIREVRPWGVDACSRLEKSPGIKDHEELLRFVRAAMARGFLTIYPGDHIADSPVHRDRLVCIRNNEGHRWPPTPGEHEPEDHRPV